MKKEEVLKLAEYLRSLEQKLGNDEYDWTMWVRGALIGVAEMLELES